MTTEDTPTSRYGTDSPTLDAALWYAAELGVQVVALGPREKRPAAGKSWPEKATATEDAIRRQWDGHLDRNVGVLLGERSGHLVDVDLDCDEARTLAPHFLPETRAVFGRHGAPRSHHVYRAVGAKHEAWQDPQATNGKATLIELRAGPAAHQTMVPPSVHPSGCAVGWSSGEYPRRADVASVEAAELRRLVSRLAAASLLVRHWPGKGARRSAALALVGGLVRAGWPDEGVFDFARLVASTGGEGANLVPGDVESTRKKIDQDGEDGARSPSGWRALAELMPEAVVTRVRVWLGVDRAKRGADGRAPHPYRASPRGIVLIKAKGDGEVVEEQLCNFEARINADVIEDDDLEPTRAFELVATLAGRHVGPFRVPAREFQEMRWVGEQLGAAAVVRAGAGVKDHVRCAIQMISTPAERRVYCHTGWRELPERGWVYIHSGGAIGAGGFVDVLVDLPRPLSLISLPEPPRGGELVEAVRAALGVLGVAPLTVTVPLFASVWRAVLGPCAFAVHLEGASGVGKTELASLVQRFFGQGMDPAHLPGSWTSTGNALESLASNAKEALLVVDDFAPVGAQKDVQRMHLEAERLLRSQGNQSGRTRMRADTSLRPAKQPRGLVLSTGEDVPGGTSLRARQVIVGVRRGEVDWDRLSTCQGDAASGLYAAALSGFVSWLAPHYGRIREGLGQREHEERLQLSTPHQRTATNTAGLIVGLRAFLRYAVACQAIAEDEADRMAEDWWSALGEVSARQADEIEAADPAILFVRLITAALRSGRAHLTSGTGFAPVNASAWGWRYDGQGQAERPMGICIGVVDDDLVYLEPSTALSAANDVGAGGDGRITVKQKTLSARLKERGLLARTEPDRATVRVQVGGSRFYALCFLASSFGVEREASHG